VIRPTLLDEAYQRADQAYRNTCKVVAGGVSVVLAVLGGWVQAHTSWAYLWSQDLAIAALTGLIATPLAPIAKDLASAVTAGANAIQSIGK
jgi:hypothetical protein